MYIVIGFPHLSKCLVGLWNPSVWKNVTVQTDGVFELMVKDSSVQQGEWLE